MSVDSVDGEWGGAGGVGGAGGADGADMSHMEIKLNITDSQLVLVEDASLWDTNAVILKVNNERTKKLYVTFQVILRNISYVFTKK